MALDAVLSALVYASRLDLRGAMLLATEVGAEVEIVLVISERLSRNTLVLGGSKRLVAERIVAVGAFSLAAIAAVALRGVSAVLRVNKPEL